MISAPRVNLSAQHIIGSGLEMFNLPILEELSYSNVKSPIDLSPLQEAPKLRQVVFKDCPGLTPSQSNFETLNSLKARGVEIELVGIPEFARGYANYGLSHAAENVLPHAIAATAPESAVLQGPNAQNQSPEEALPTYTTTDHALFGDVSY